MRKFFTLQAAERLLAVTPLLACACIEAPPALTPPVDQRVAIPAAPELGVQLLLPERVVPAGADQQWCVVSSWVPEEDTLIKSFESHQGSLGHHLMGLTSAIPRVPGEEFDCTIVEQMATLQPLITPTTSTREGGGNLLSDEFTVRLPAGVQVVIQSHYVNVTTNDILVRDVANFVFLPADESRIEANYLVLNDDNLKIPATNERYAHTTECTVQNRFQFAALMGHMHEWGKAAHIEHVQASTGTATVIYDQPAWTAEFRDTPPVVRWPTTAPMVFEAGDKLRQTCEWENDTDSELKFPNEMCASLMVYFPALPEGFVVCD